MIVELQLDADTFLKSFREQMRKALACELTKTYWTSTRPTAFAASLLNALNSHLVADCFAAALAKAKAATLVTVVKNSKVEREITIDRLKNK